MKRAASWLSILAIYLAVSSVKAQTFVTNGLIAYYPFNGNANDASGYGNDATVFGATLTTDRFGVAGMAYEFNGTNSYMIANVPNLPTGSAARTISLWAKPEPLLPVQGARLVFWGTNINTEAFGPLNNSSPYRWQGGGWGGGNFVDTDVLVDTNWHHIVETYDGAACSIWIDGKKYGPTAIPINTPLSPLYIGCVFDASLPGTNQLSQFFSGSINEVRVYDRAITSQEVTELFQSFELGIITLPTITITRITNQIYSIQYVNSPEATNWTTLVSNIVLQSNFYIYPDTNAINQPKRFYRVLAQ